MKAFRGLLICIALFTAPLSAAVGAPNFPDETEMAPVRASLSQAMSATAYLVGDEWDRDRGTYRDTTGVIAGYFVLRSAPAPSAGWVDSLRSILSSPENYERGDFLCIAIPGYVVRLRGATDSVTVVMSTTCGFVAVKPSNGPWTGGWVLSAESELRDLMNRALRSEDCTCTPPVGRFQHPKPAPVAIRTPAPVVPDSLRSGSPERVKLLVHVGQEGLPCHIKAISRVYPFDLLAVQAVREWRWKPAMSNGQPVCVWAEVPVEFETR